MGKVGSMTIFRSIQKYYSGAVLHAHHLSSDQEIPELECIYRWTTTSKKPINRPIKIISLVREPISRNVSDFFQNFLKYTGVAYDDSEFSIGELKKIFLSNYDHDIPSTWFDNNILKWFEIDVFDTPFSNLGYSQYTNKNINLLVLKIELEDSIKIEIIKNFLQLDYFQLLHENISKEKNYSQTYEEFRYKVKFPDDYIERICNSKFFNHFYGRDEIENVKNLWRKQ